MLKNLPDLIRASASSPLGIVALIIVVLSLLSYFMFGRSHLRYRLLSFCMLFGAFIALAFQAFWLTEPLKTVQNKIESIKEEAKSETKKAGPSEKPIAERGLAAAQSVDPVSVLRSQDRAFTVIIDPAHGGSREGCRVGDLVEKQFTLRLARSLQSAIQKRSIPCVLTRSDDVDLAQSERALMGLRYPNSVFISLHADCADSETTNGFMIMWRTKPSKALAEQVQKKLQSVGILAPREMNNEVPPAVLTMLGNVPTIAIELGFITNRHDLAILMNDATLMQLSKAISNAIAMQTGA